MHDAEAFVKGIVAVVKDLRDRLTARIAPLETAINELLPRIRALEERAPVPGLNGKDGAVGPVGPRGPAGERGSPGSDAVVPADWLPRLVALEARQAEAVTDEDIAAEIATLLRHELLGALPAPPKMQKRVIRDRQGKIERVVEEPVES